MFYIIQKLAIKEFINITKGIICLLFLPFPELVIVQAILLAVLILLSVIWACCCKKRCIGVSTKRKIGKAPSLNLVSKWRLYREFLLLLRV